MNEAMMFNRPFLSLYLKALSILGLVLSVTLMQGCGGAENNRVNFRGKPDAFLSVARPALNQNIDGQLNKPATQQDASAFDQRHINMAQEALFGQQLQAQSGLSAQDVQFIQRLGGNLNPQVALDFDAEQSAKRDLYRPTTRTLISGLQSTQVKGPQDVAIDPHYEWLMLQRQNITNTPAPYAQEGYRIYPLQQGQIRSGR